MSIMTGGKTESKYSNMQITKLCDRPLDFPDCEVQTNLIFVRFCNSSCPMERISMKEEIFIMFVMYLLYY